MTNNTKEWLIALGVPYCLLTLITMSEFGFLGLFAVPFFILFCATIGVYGGIGSVVKYINVNGHISRYDIGFLSLLVFAVGLFVVGMYYKKQAWGKSLVVLGLICWCYAGFQEILSYG